MNEKPFKYHKVKINLHEHLTNIRNRLISDVGPYVDLIQKKARKEKIGIGNFALIRMLFPPIETICVVLYSQKETT